MDALEALGDDRLHPGQAHALGCPVARRTLPVVGAGDDDQRLLALHVGLDGFPHAHHLAFRLDPRQRTLLHAAVGVAHHLVEQLRVGEGRALCGEVVAAVGGVGVEVLLGQAHFRQVFARCAVGEDRVGRRQVVGGDVVRQHRQGAHAAQGAFAGEGAFPVRRAADVSARRAPGVERVDLLALAVGDVEHRDVDLAELLGLHRRPDHRVDLLVARPEVLQADLLAVHHAEHVALDVEADGPGDGVGHHQRRRGEEGLLGVGVDAPVEVAVAGEHRGGVQVALDDLLLDRRVEGAGHAVARRTGVGHHAEAEGFQVRQQAGFAQVFGDHLGAGCQRGLHPWLADQAEAVGVARQQAGGDHVARVAGVGATGDRGDDHRAVRHQALGFLDAGPLEVAGDAFRRQFAGGDPGVRIGRAGHVAHHAGQVELQYPLVLGVDQAVGPESGGARIGLHQGDLLVVAAGEAQVVDGLLVDGEHRRGGAVFRSHVGDGRAVAEGQAGGAFAVELQVGADHLLLAQELGQGQHHVGGGDARLATAAQLDADDVRQAHPGGAAEHHVFRFQAADADGDHAQGVDVRGMAVGAHAGIGEGHAVARLDHRRHFLQVDLVHDAVARRDHVDVAEGLLGPVDEVEAVLVAAVLDGAVLGEGLGVVAAAFHRQRVVDDQLHRHHRVDLGRVAALVGDGVAQAGEVDQRGLSEDVMADHPRRVPGEVEVALALDQLAQRSLQGRRVAAAHQVLGEHAGGIGQLGVGAGLDRLDRLAGVEVVQAGAGERFAVCAVHGSDSITGCSEACRSRRGAAHAGLSNSGCGNRPARSRSARRTAWISVAPAARTRAARRRCTRRSGG